MVAGEKTGDDGDDTFVAVAVADSFVNIGWDEIDSVEVLINSTDDEEDEGEAETERAVEMSTNKVVDVFMSLFFCLSLSLLLSLTHFLFLFPFSLTDACWVFTLWLVPSFTVRCQSLQERERSNFVKRDQFTFTLLVSQVHLPWVLWKGRIGKKAAKAFPSRGHMQVCVL